MKDKNIIYDVSLTDLNLPEALKSSNFKYGIEETDNRLLGIHNLIKKQR